MIKTINQLKTEYSKYNNIPSKLSYDEKRGIIIRLKRGLYETDKNIDPLLLANNIVSPSYISFESALSYYNLIPENVTTITSASFNKRKMKLYKNYFGTFIYNDIPTSVYSDLVVNDTSKKYGFLIATKEKALLDMLYKTSPVKNINEIEQLLYYDLRISKDAILQLNIDSMNKIAHKYRDKNINLFLQYLMRLKNE